MTARTPSRAAPARRPSPGDLRALEALTSPVRQELLSAMNQRPTTVRDLAVRLGRTRQALYHHVRILLAAGLIRPAGMRGEGRLAEQVYATVPGRMVLGGIRRSARWLAALDRSAAALLRQTQREFSAAVRSDSCRTGGPGRGIVALRGKARLSPRELARVNALIDQITALLQRAKARRSPGRLYAVTLVLTPSREAAPQETP